MLGLVAYAQNRLAAAATEFEQVVALRYSINSRTYQDAMIGLCLIARARGDAARVAGCAADVRLAPLQAGDPVSLALADWVRRAPVFGRRGSPAGRSTAGCR
jgi:hypothetical protein